MNKIREGDYWRNKKNGEFYQIVREGTVVHSETKEKLVLYAGSDGRTWARPLELFLEKFELDNG